MMKKVVLFVLSLMLCLGATARSKSDKSEKSANSAVLKTNIDTISYAFGMNIGKQIRMQFDQPDSPIDTINAEQFSAAICEALSKGSNFAIKPEKVDSILNAELMKIRQAKNSKDLERNKVWLAENAKKPGVMQTASGLQYKVIAEGTGIKPKATDKVKVNYTGTLIDGTVFDGNAGGNPVEFDLDKVITGWTEGIQLMQVGAKYRFFIPSELAYGERSMGKIKPNSILIFDVDLLEVVKKGAKFQFQPYQRGN